MSSDRKQNDGGPAFPGEQGHTPEGSWNQTFSPGMTLRDAFALGTLPAVIAATSAGQHMPAMQEGEPHIRFAIARDAYDMADAMLKAREAKQ